MNSINTSVTAHGFTSTINLSPAFWKECGDEIISELNEYVRVHTKIIKQRSENYEKEYAAANERLKAWENQPFFIRWFSEKPSFTPSPKIISNKELVRIIEGKIKVEQSIQDIESIRNGGLDTLVTHCTLTNKAVSEVFQHWSNNANTI